MAHSQHLLHIGNNVKQLREFRNLTQQQLADAIGVNIETIQAIETGNENFNIDTLVSIANVLNFYLDISFTPAK